MEMENIRIHLDNLRQEISPAQLLVVSKYREVDHIKAIYDAGQRMFAENRVQALLERVEALPKDIQWHLIGHLQSNKAKYIVPFILTIHSVDSVKLLDAINKEAAKKDRKIRVLFQLKVAQEKTKFGWETAQLLSFVNGFSPEFYTHIQFAGIMAMATNTSDKGQITAEFKEAKHIFDQLKPTFGKAFTELSLGMSGDAKEAVDCGSTMVRMGTAVFEQ